MRKTLIAVLTLLTLAACASAPRSPEEEFTQLANKVEREIAAAEARGFLWRDTEKLLDQARQARKQNRHDEAMKLLQQALAQAELAQRQAGDNADAGLPAP